jgi:two-component system, OmpR family, copper resistance phosphate regulon response regulator CusR
MKILIVEDEPKTGDYLKQGLSEASFVTDLARDGWDRLEMAKGQHYDLMILDVMLPGLDGWQVLEGVRRAGVETPILHLTVRDQVEDRVIGSKAGRRRLSGQALRLRRAAGPDSHPAAPGLAGAAILKVADPELWTCCGDGPPGQDAGSISRPRNLPCWNCSCAGRGKCCPAV